LIIESCEVADHLCHVCIFGRLIHAAVPCRVTTIAGIS
jgi:hypothetical protein